MTTLSQQIPQVGQSDATEDVKIANNFTTLTTWANGNIDGTNISATVTGRRLVGQAAAFLGPAAGGAGNFFVAQDGSLIATGGNFSKALVWFYLDPANFAVAGKVNTQLIVRMSLAVAVAPALTFSGELASLTFGGSTGNIVPSFVGQQGGAAGIGSPAGSSANVAESAAGAFAFPAAGAYAPVINLNGTSAANSATSILWQLFALNS